MPTNDDHLVLDAALASRDDLDQFGGHKRALFALQIEFGIEDIDSVASDAIVDGPDDKNIDIVYVDDATGHLVVCQDYEAEKTKKEAPASKARGLAQGFQWLLGMPIEEVPERIRSVAIQAREAIESGVVGSIDIWYVHNCGESTNVDTDLNAVLQSVNSIVASNFPTSELNVATREIGLATLEAIYSSTQVAIEVVDDFEIDAEGIIELGGENWSAICSTVPGEWLVAKFREYGEALFSANIRGYLGSKRSDRNINNGIKETAKTDPEDFWVFNNG